MSSASDSQPRVGYAPTSSGLLSLTIRNPHSRVLDILKGILGLVKRRARKLFLELIKADDRETGQTTAQERRYEAARGLIDILKNERGGEEIVARCFGKISRQDQGARALLKLSDDELDRFGYKAVSPISDSLAFTELLHIVLKYARKPIFFKTTISAALKEAGDGVAAILYLAIVERKRFFLNVDRQLVLNFCRQVVTTEKSLCPKWYCGVKLLCILFMNDVCPEGSGVLPVACRILPTILKELIQKAQITPSRDATEGLKDDSAITCPPLLPLIAVCCEEIRNRGYWSAVPPSDILNPFIAILIDFLRPEIAGPWHLSAECEFALLALMSLLKRRSIVSLIPSDNLRKVGEIFMDVVLHHPRDLVIPRDNFEKFTFNNALAVALNRGISQFDHPPDPTNPYKPLRLVERLLWMSNIPPRAAAMEQIHRAMVNGGGLAPQDRGLWRVKGLAVTCFGNIVERMNPRQLDKHITEDMFDAVVAFKEREDAPLVQKGQAIYTLQRYSKAADRWGSQPYYRETTNVAEESSGTEPDDA
ncbi:hypothetical protein FRC04_009644 [Tulasnella sp. 424]|nr:hypothetical protein FRC04_009644 [Tulasnella sp. 424]